MKTVAAASLKGLTFTDIRLYLVSAVFTAGNVSLPLVLHHFGTAGQIFLPLYFFSLLSGLAFGWRSGILTGLASPLISNFYSGMPVLTILPFVVFKSFLLGGVSGLLAERIIKIKGRVFLIAFLAVAITQICGISSINFITHNSRLALLDITLGYPGLLLQIFFVPALIKIISRHEDQTLV